MKYCLLAGVVAVLIGCGGGGDVGSAAAPIIEQPAVVAPVAYSVPSVELAAYRGQPFVFTQFEHSGASVGDNSLTLEFDITFDKYFQCVSDGHLGVMLHADLGHANGDHIFRGHGIIFSKFPTGFGGLPAGVPVASFESWWAAAAPAGTSAVIGSTASSALSDGTYHVVVKSYVASDGKHIAYRMNDSTGVVVGEFDYLDPNTLVDMSLDSMVIYDATTTIPTCDYSVKFENMKVSWK
jgi:hypothetical protein